MTHCPVGFAAAFMCSLETSQGDEESERGGDDVRRVSENDSTGFAAGETDFFYIYFEEEGEKMGVMMAMTMCTAILYIQLVDCCVHKYTLDLVGLRGAWLCETGLSGASEGRKEEEERRRRKNKEISFFPYLWAGQSTVQRGCALKPRKAGIWEKNKSWPAFLYDLCITVRSSLKDTFFKKVY